MVPLPQSAASHSKSTANRRVPEARLHGRTCSAIAGAMMDADECRDATLICIGGRVVKVDASMDAASGGCWPEPRFAETQSVPEAAAGRGPRAGAEARPLVYGPGVFDDLRFIRHATRGSIEVHVRVV